MWGNRTVFEEVTVLFTRLFFTTVVFQRVISALNLGKEGVIDAKSFELGASKWIQKIHIFSKPSPRGSF
jgi:hypothetical protein